MGKTVAIVLAAAGVGGGLIYAKQKGLFPFSGAVGAGSSTSGFTVLGVTVTQEQVGSPLTAQVSLQNNGTTAARYSLTGTLTQGGATQGNLASSSGTVQPGQTVQVTMVSMGALSAAFSGQTLGITVTEAGGSTASTTFTVGSSGSGSGSGSGTGSSTSAPTTAPTPSVQVTGPRQATVSWQAVPGADHYGIQHTDASGNPSGIPILVGGQSGSSFQTAGTAITVSTTYTGGASIDHLTITACNQAGCSAPSGVVTISFPG
ncbi:MAG: hypothetical protein ACYCU5_14305 [Actinomycetes bacterium]